MTTFRLKPKEPRLFGEEWLDDGYVTTSTFETPDACLVCGSAGNNCTGESHGTAEEEAGSEEGGVSVLFGNYQERLIDAGPDPDGGPDSEH